MTFAVHGTRIIIYGERHICVLPSISWGSIAHSVWHCRAVAHFMYVLSMWLRVDLSDFEQGKHAYESGRSSGGVCSCTPCAMRLPQLHELVRTCDMEFTASMSSRGMVRQSQTWAVGMADYIFQKSVSTAQSAWGHSYSRGSVLGCVHDAHLACAGMLWTVKLYSELSYQPRWA